MFEKQNHEGQFPVAFTQAQRIVVARLFPELAHRLRLDEANQKTVSLTLHELNMICKEVAPAIRLADSGMKRTSLRHVLDITERALDNFQGIGVIPVKERIYQLKITLQGYQADDLAANSSERLQPGQAPRAYSTGDGLDQLASASLQD